MTVPSRERERRDWTLIVFLIPLGIILIIIVGQLAIRMFPNWVINADMRSNLDPNSAPGQPASLLQPLLPQILTPMAWAENYLTPAGAGGDISFPPFIVLEPTNTPTSTPASPTPTTPSPTTTTPSPTTTFTATPNPTDDDENPTPAPVSGCTNPAALNYNPSATVDDGSCTYPPVSGCTDPAALNYNPLATVDDGSCTYPPISGCTNPAALNYNPLATVDDGSCTYPPTGYPSTPDLSWTLISPAPPAINTDVPDDNVVNLPSGPNGSFAVLEVSGNPVNVGMTPDNNYDLVFYESQVGSNIMLDHIIIGISHFSDGSSYFEVFNWGNGIPDNNSNIGDIAGTEEDNQSVPTSELYDPDYIGPGNDGPAPSTGILIDVDTSTSEPPPGNYNYIVIISPNSGDGDPSQIDAVVVTEVPIPTP